MKYAPSALATPSKRSQRSCGSSSYECDGERFAHGTRRLSKAAIVLERLPAIERSPDPADNFLLAMAESGEADYLVTGDKRHVLALIQHGRTHIVTVRQMLTVLESV